MPERFRGELLTMGRYTNPASFSQMLESLHVTSPLLLVPGAGNTGDVAVYRSG